MTTETPLDTAARQLSEMEAAYAGTFADLEAKLAGAQMEAAGLRLERDSYAELLRATAERFRAPGRPDEIPFAEVPSLARDLREGYDCAMAGMEMAAASCVSRDLVQQAFEVMTQEIAEAPAPWQRLRRAESLLRKALGR